MFGGKLADYLKSRSHDPSVRVNRHPFPDGEASGHITLSSEPTTVKGEPVERDRVEGISVGQSSESRFTDFLDGIERTSVPYFESMLPVVYGYTSAVIRRRDAGRSMGTWSITPTHDREHLFVPFSLVEPSSIREAQLPVIDSEQHSKVTAVHPMAVQEKGYQAVEKLRGRLEAQLAREWIRDHKPSDDRWLVIDGSLTEYVDNDGDLNAIGIVKSHRTQYFPFEEQKKVLALAEGERSPVFRTPGRLGAYSWYLRLRPNTGRDIYFGLVRIEAPPVPRTLEMADEISRWLMAERSPISLPDSRWDRLIYPIRDCEQYLRSLAPSRIMIEAAFSGI
ncbi:MAG: hypothetical protein Q7T82_17440 [Armatimonadota bacterium]|nr:hypothetical protein [Armatimonadota bacterium]